MSPRAPFTTSAIDGTVTHARSGDIRHAFTYPYRAALVDVDELEALERAAWPMFGVDRRRPLTIRTRDHLALEEGATLRDRVRSCLARHEVTVDADGRLLGLLTLRGIGTGFDPVTVWLWYPAASERPEAMVVDVHNTYGESHPYACAAGDEDDGWIRARFDKRFHVSPFLPTDGTYDIAVLAPRFTPSTEQRIELRVRFRDASGSDRLTAVLRGPRAPLTRRGVRWTLARRSLQGVTSALRIRLRAWRLWRLGARFRHKPEFHPRRGHVADTTRSTS